MRLVSLSPDATSGAVTSSLLIFSSSESDLTGIGAELEATASTEELGSVEEVSAELEAGVDEAEGTMDVGLVTVEAAFAAVL